VIADEAIKFDNCDDAIIGVDQRGYLVYDYSKLVEVFKKQGMTTDEAVEWIDYNVLGVKPDHYTIIYTQTYDDIF
jgi:hypothetical protein